MGGEEDDGEYAMRERDHANKEDGCKYVTRKRPYVSKRERDHVSNEKATMQSRTENMPSPSYVWTSPRAVQALCMCDSGCARRCES